MVGKAVAPVAVERGRWSDLRAGFIAIVPLWLGAAPFGAIYAVNARAAGISPAQTLAMSLVVFAGAAQFTAVGLVASGTSASTIVITTLIINLRHLLFSASLAPWVRQLGAPFKALLAFGLTDETYAVGMRRLLSGRGSGAYQLGCNLSMYAIWQTSTVAGLFLGALIPDPAAYGLDIVFPLTFIALLMPLLRTRVDGGVALLATLLAVGGALLLPGKWYVLVAGVVASAAAALATRQGRL